MKSAVAIIFMCNAFSLEVLAFGDTIRTPPSTFSRVNDPSVRQNSSRHHAAIFDMKDGLKDIEKDFERRVRLESLLWFFPIGMSASAFMLQRPTSAAFHKLYALVNEKAGDMNALELITPALNGPVSTSISILFGTLVAITISSLYSRQDAMHKTLITMGEDLHHGSLLIQGLPPAYSRQAKEYLDDFSHRLCRAFLTGDYRVLGYRNHGLNEMVLFLNQLSQLQLQQQSSATKKKDDDTMIFISGTIVSQLYDLVNRIQAERSQLLATFRTTFPVWHYLNLAMLAAAICTIFLMEIDLAVLKLLDAFEIRTCWAMLIGAFSMLGMVCYDLTTPYSGIFRILSSKDAELEFIEDDNANIAS